MKVEIFTPVVYYGDIGEVEEWPLRPRLHDSKYGALSIRLGFEQMEAAYEAGFDSLNLAEHHYSSRMTPAPHLFAAALGERLPDAQIGLFGTDLPLHNPLQVAEQYAMLDNMLNGRLRFALLRGTPNEYMTYGTNPWESRDRFEEAVRLVIRAYTEPEPFGWEGRYYRYRNISLFPQPVQKPLPRILLSANSVASARFAGRMRCDAGLSFMPPAKCAAVVAAYREAAAESGWTPTADNILYRQYVYVAETDEQAREDIGPGWGNGAGLFSSRNHDLMGAMVTAAGALAGVPKGVTLDPSRAPAFGKPMLGSPDTVLAQIREAEKQIGMGRLEMVIAGPPTTISHDKIVRSIKLIGQDLIPALHAAAPAAG